MRLVSVGSDRLAPRDAAAYSRWILDAGNPYLGWFLGGPARALEIISEWRSRKSSELSLARATALLEGERVLGGYIALRGRDLARCRKADLLWLLKRCSAAERRDLSQRLENSRELFAPVPAEHCYLSKIGLLPEYRGQGFGSFLLDAFISASVEKGYDTLRLDVCADNQAAIRLYRRRGFEVIGEAELAPLGVWYLAMTTKGSS